MTQVLHLRYGGWRNMSVINETQLRDFIAEVITTAGYAPNDAIIFAAMAVVKQVRERYKVEEIETALERAFQAQSEQEFLDALSLIELNNPLIVGFLYNVLQNARKNLVVLWRIKYVMARIFGVRGIG
jgi:hypothetical protein